MPWAGEEVFYFLEVGQLLETAQVEELGGRCGKKWSMGHGANGGHVTQQLDIRGRGAEVVVANHGRNRLSPELAVTCGVNMFVDTAAGNVRSIFEVVQQVLFTGMQDFELDVFPEVRAVDQKFQAAP
ncbi:hypothetical protein D3C81_1875720 [compost metagenome]